MAKNSLNRNTKRLNSKTIIFFVSLIAFIILFALFFGDKGLFEILKKEKQIKSLQLEIEHLKEEKKDLIQKIIKLKNDPYALEKIAREELWLMKENEKVIVIQKDPQSQGKKKDNGKKDQ